MRYIQSKEIPLPIDLWEGESGSRVGDVAGKGSQGAVEDRVVIFAT